MNKNFFNTIRFKLTFFYSLTLFLFGGIFVFGTNAYLNNQVRENFNILPPEKFEDLRIPPRLKELSREQLKEVQQVRNEDLQRFRQISVFSLFPLAIISFIGGFYISGQLLKPLDKLNKKISKINVEKLNSPLEGGYSNDEIGSLVNNFNIMLGRLYLSFNQQKQFIQDASHEIKTPLAIVQTNLDTILSDKTATTDELRKSIKYALNGVENLNNLTEDLLTLSLPRDSQKNKFNLSELLIREIGYIKDRVNNSGIILEKEIEKDCFIYGNEFEISRVIKNLLDNSIKYVDENKKIKISLKENNFVISNTTKEISNSELELIFDRFYKVDKSRSRKNGGYGLGLSITKKLLEDNNSTIKATYTNGEIQFKIKFTN